MRKVVATAIPLACLLGLGSAAESGAQPSPGMRLTQQWDVDLPDGHIIAQSSPAVAMIDGTAQDPKAAVVVGDRSGALTAVDLESGNARQLFSSSLPIDAPPSAAPTTPGGLDTVFFGRGNQAIACRGPGGAWGGYTALRADGSVLWKGKVNNPPGDTSCSHNGVMAGMTLVTLKGTLSVIGMSLGQAEHGFVAATGAPLSGWNPWFQADSSTSTVAVAQLNGPSKPPSIIEGGDSTQGNAYGVQYFNGGHVRIIKPQGNKGTAGSGGLTCAFDTYAQGGQIVASSPAVGGLLSDGAIGIASGQGYFAPYHGPVNRLWVVNTSCRKVWSAKTDYLTSSPILVDVNGDAKLDVVVGTQDVSVGGQPDHGSVYAFDGSTGSLLWSTPTGSVVGSLAAADLRGTGHADVVVATASGSYGGGIQVLDGANGDRLWSQWDGTASQGTPLITADAGGRIGITLAGYYLNGGTGQLAGRIRHFTVNGSSSADLADPLTSWLEFHHDPKLSGNVAGPLP